MIHNLSRYFKCARDPTVKGEIGGKSKTTDVFARMALTWCFNRDARAQVLARAFVV